MKVSLLRSMTVALLAPVKVTMRSPFTAMVVRMGSRAVLEKTPATFIMLAIAPPVILDVCS